MKILHVALSLSSRCGGPSLAVHDMARFQAQSGLDVTVFSTNADYPSGILDVPVRSTILKNGVYYQYFSVQFRPLLVSLPMAVQLRKSVKTYDLLHLHGLYRFPTTYAAHLSRKHKVPYIIEPHGSLDPFMFKQSAHNITAKRVYEKFFDLPNLNSASAIHYSSSEEKTRAGFLDLRPPGMIVPNGIDWKRFKDLPARGAIRQRIGMKDEPMILFLSRINFKKGLDLLVQAFAEITKSIDNAVLVIAGPDNDGYTGIVRKWIAELDIGTKVYWLGMLDDQQVLQAYVDADVFVLPSYTENFGIAVVEAMACGLPVVISDQVNIWTEVKDSGAGLSVRLDSHEIAKAILRVITEDNLAKHMGHSGRRFAKNRYTYDVIIQKVHQMYAAVIEKRCSQ